MSKIKIAWLFPDTLYLHGERGNIMALERFARLGGFDVETTKVDFDTVNFDPLDYDIMFCPPGEITSFPAVIQWLMPYQEKLESFIQQKRPLIVTGTSIGIWGNTVERTDGTSFSGLGIIDIHTKENEQVYGDDNDFICQYNGEEIEVIGNQIQMADFVNHNEAPFGTLIYGYGNTGKNREEGFQKENSIFTNTLAPMLVVTPKLTMEIIRVVAKNKGLNIPEFDVDVEIETQSFMTKKEFILGKESRLTNCK
ncbi:CobQ-like glutamine amidotransferase family enzyme [Clostridiales Family XIII bacterium PM5-7]